MKLVVAVVHNRDKGRVVEDLIRNGFKFTIIGSTGGFLKEGNTQVFYWIDKPFGYALAGDLSREELQPLAQLVYRQINP